MRRKDREVTSPEAIREIIDACKVFRVAFMGEDFPYVVPLNFGYTWEDGQLIFYFHCASEGRKLDLLRKNPRVAFEMDCGHALMESDVPCGYGYRFQSVMGLGLAQEVTDVAEKKSGPFLPDGPPDRESLFLHRSGSGAGHRVPGFGAGPLRQGP